MISTRDLRLLPDVQRLRLAFQSMALLDAIIMPEWQFRYYSFQAPTENFGGIAIGYMRNGSGDDVHAIFGHVGCVIRGFAHEYPMSPYASDPVQVFPGVLSEVPEDFKDCLAAVHSDWWRATTFCVWRRHSDRCWYRGNINFPDHHRHDPDGSEFLLSAYDGRPETYQRWAEGDYSGTGPTFSLDAIRSVFEHRPLTDEIIRELNPERSLSELLTEVQEIGYPFQAYPAPATWPSLIVDLAQQLYDGANVRLILHDALLDAGHAELAEHFQREESHPRGCWALDLLLAKQ
jgi:hypothetical protein